MPTLTETDGTAVLARQVDRLEAHTVVDCDVHEFTPDDRVFQEYIDDRWADRIAQQTETVEPLTQSLRGTYPFDVDPSPHGLDDDVSPMTADGLTAFMDRFNTDYVILHGHEIQGASSVPDKAFAAAICSAYNDMLLDRYLDEADGLKGVIRVAPQAPQRAAEEIHRLADEDDMVGVGIPATPPNGLLGDPMYEPIFDAAESEGLPIDYHPALSNMPWASLWGGQWLHSTVEALTVYPHHMIAHLPSMLFQGIPEKFPDLDHIFLEQGFSWLPWLRGRLDQSYERRKHDLSWLDRPPSESLAENFYFGTHPMEDPAGPAVHQRLFDLIDGENTLVYASDFPHFDYDVPSILTIPNVEDEVAAKIFGGNAMDVYAF